MEDSAGFYWMRFSNYIFILDLAPGFIELGKDNCKTRRETFKFCDLVSLTLKVWRYLATPRMLWDSLP